MRNKEDKHLGKTPFPSAKPLLPFPIPSPLPAGRASSLWWDNGHHRRRWSVCGVSFHCSLCLTQMLWWGSPTGHGPLGGVPALENPHPCSSLSSCSAPVLPWIRLIFSLLFLQHLPCSGVSLAPAWKHLLVLCLLWHPSFSGISSCLVVTAFLKYVFAEVPYAPLTGSVLGTSGSVLSVAEPAGNSCDQHRATACLLLHRSSLQPLLLPKPYNYAQYSKAFQLSLSLMYVTLISVSTFILLTSSAFGYRAQHLSELNPDWKLWWL